MLQSSYQSFEQLPVILNMKNVAAVLGISESGAYDAIINMQPDHMAAQLVLAHGDGLHQGSGSGIQGSQSLLGEVGALVHPLL